MRRSIRLTALMTAIVTIAASCQADRVSKAPSGESTGSIATTSPNGSVVRPNENGYPDPESQISPSSPDSTFVDCLSGTRQPLESRSYVYRLQSAAAVGPVVPIAVGGSPISLSAADSTVWVTIGTADESNEYQLISIDAITNEITGTVELSDFGIVEAGDDVWVSHFWKDQIIRFDSTTLRPTATIRMPPLESGFTLGSGEQDNCFGPREMSLGEGGLWVYGRGVVARIHVEANKTETVIAPPRGELSKGGQILARLGTVWLTTNVQRVWRIKPRSDSWMDGLAFDESVGHTADHIAATHDVLWVSGPNIEKDAQGNPTGRLAEDGGGVTGLSLDGSVVRTSQFTQRVMVAADGAEQVVAWEQGTGLWVMEHDGRLPSTPLVCSSARASGLAIAEDVVWVSMSDAGEVWRIDLSPEREGCSG